MKRALLSIAIAMLVACASTSSSNEGPPLQATLLQVGAPSPDTYYFRGPVNIQYALTIKNPTNEQFTLRRLDIQSVGQGAYRVRTGAQAINQRVNPNGTTTIHLATWGTAMGGFISSTEPVTLRVIGQFEGPNGRFQKIFTETILQY